VVRTTRKLPRTEPKTTTRSALSVERTKKANQSEGTEIDEGIMCSLSGSAGLVKKGGARAGARVGGSRAVGESE